MRNQAKRYTPKVVADVVVLGGMKITVDAEIEPADRSVGIFEAYPGEWFIVAINGRTVKHNESTSWLEKRIKAAGQENMVIEALMVELNEGGCRE